MPIYEYRCGECGRRSSALLSRWDAPDPACPHCGKQSLRRLVSTFATIGREDSDGDDLDDRDDGDFGGGEDDFDSGDGSDDDW